MLGLKWYLFEIQVKLILCLEDTRNAGALSFRIDISTRVALKTEEVCFSEHTADLLPD